MMSLALIIAGVISFWVDVNAAATTKKPPTNVKYFDYTASLVYEKGTQCRKKANGGDGFVQPTDLKKPVGVCTTNIIGSTVMFECDKNKGVILEHVFYDASQKNGGGGKKGSCDGKKLYTMPISNGCNDYTWGAMLMTWEGFCPKPSSSKTTKKAVVGSKTTKKPTTNVKYFDYTASLVYEKGTQCKKKANGGDGFVQPTDLKKPVGVC